MTGKDGHEAVSQPQTHEERSDEPISASNVSIDTWKADYDEQVRSWHAESAEARARAVKERTRWETIRAAEREKAALEPHEPEWESVAKKDEGSAVVPDVSEANVRHSRFLQVLNPKLLSIGYFRTTRRTYSRRVKR